MEILSEQDKHLIIEVLGVDYDSMSIGSSAILVRIGESWSKLGDVDCLTDVELVCKLTKNILGPSFAVTAKVNIPLGSDAQSIREKMDDLQLESQFMTASVGASTSRTHVEASAKLTAAAGESGPISYHVGAGVSTGAGIKDDSVTVKVAGMGVQVGRKVGLSVFDNSFSIDLAKLF